MRWKKCVQCAAGGPKSAVWRNPAVAVYHANGTPDYTFWIKQQRCGALHLLLYQTEFYNKALI